MNPLQMPVDYRLAFRELGLSIGLKAVKRLNVLVAEKPDLFKKWSSLNKCMGMLMQYTRLSEVVESFWCEPTNREVKSWVDHRDINSVMLATSLAVDGFLTI
jgi:hypothetical protein